MSTTKPTKRRKCVAGSGDNHDAPSGVNMAHQHGAARGKHAQGAGINPPASDAAADAALAQRWLDAVLEVTIGDPSADDKVDSHALRHSLLEFEQKERAAKGQSASMRRIDQDEQGRLYLSYKNPLWAAAVSLLKDKGVTTKTLCVQGTKTNPYNGLKFRKEDESQPRRGPGAENVIGADGAGEETMSGGAGDETLTAHDPEGAEHSDANSAGCIAAAELVLQKADQEEKAFLRRQLDLEAQKSVILRNLLKAKEQELCQHKAEAQQQLEKSNKEAAQVTVPRCVRCSLVASKQVHAADFDANFAGRILLLPWRKTRLRRRRHKRNMTNS